MIKNDLAKMLLTRVGTVVPGDFITSLDGGLNYLETGRWLKQASLSIPTRVKRREEVFDIIAGRIADRRVLYLEFGVLRGASLHYWSKALRNPDAALHAFDKFEGLPEGWGLSTPKGTFSTGGRLPEIDDPRVQFFVGWFSDTLPKYELPPHDELVINVDSDLYSSAKTILDVLRPHIHLGSFIYFDEYSDRMNEQRAFREYLAATGQRFEVVAATRALRHLAFRRVA